VGGVHALQITHAVCPVDKTLTSSVAFEVARRILSGDAARFSRGAVVEF